MVSDNTFAGIQREGGVVESENDVKLKGKTVIVTILTVVIEHVQKNDENF